MLPGLVGQFCRRGVGLFTGSPECRSAGGDVSDGG